MVDYLVPVILITVIAIACFKRINIFSSFIKGARESIDLTISLLPYLVAIYLMLQLLKVSGLDLILVRLVSPPLVALGIPHELAYLVLLRPFSGSGSLAILNQIYTTYGVDSYLGRSASVIVSSSETIFYIAAVYFADTNVKKLGLAIPISLFCSIVGCILSCLLCKIMF